MFFLSTNQTRLLFKRPQVIVETLSTLICVFIVTVLSPGVMRPSTKTNLTNGTQLLLQSYVNPAPKDSITHYALSSPVCETIFSNQFRVNRKKRLSEKLSWLFSENWFVKDILHINHVSLRHSMPRDANTSDTANRARTNARGNNECQSITVNVKPSLKPHGTTATVEIGEGEQMRV